MGMYQWIHTITPCRCWKKVPDRGIVGLLLRARFDSGCHERSQENESVKHIKTVDAGTRVIEIDLDD